MYACPTNQRLIVGNAALGVPTKIAMALYAER